MSPSLNGQSKNELRKHEYVCSILVTVLFLRDDTVCLDSLLILHVDSENKMFYIEP